MSLTIQMLSHYLGGTVAAILAEPPFVNWPHEKSFETGLDEPLIDFIFPQHGIDFVCGGDHKVRTIFLHCSNSRCFREGVEDLPFDLTREEVIIRLGAPSKSGDKSNGSILGQYGPWDRFARPGYTIHVQFQVNADSIKLITLMGADVVPE